MERFVYSHFEFHAASCILRYNWIMLAGLKKYYNRSLPSGCSSSSKGYDAHFHFSKVHFYSCLVEPVTKIELHCFQVVIRLLSQINQTTGYQCIFVIYKEQTCIFHWDFHIGIDCSHMVPQAPLRDRGYHLEKHSKHIKPDTVALFLSTVLYLEHMGTVDHSVPRNHSHNWFCSLKLSAGAVLHPRQGRPPPQPVHRNHHAGL